MTSLDCRAKKTDSLEYQTKAGYQKKAVRLVAASARYAIVQPVVSAPRLDQLWLADGVDDFRNYLADIPADEKYVAIDLETTGTKFWETEFKIVTLGLSCSIGSIALDTRDMNRKQFNTLLKEIQPLPLIAHNAQFDMGCLVAYNNSFYDFNLQYDTLGLYHQLANEGFTGQKHGLKFAQKEMLTWPATNEGPMYEHLVGMGYCNPPKPDLSEDERIELYRAKKLRPVRSEMHRVPHHILGHYCALDCDSTWQLMTMVLEPALKRIPPQLVWFHQGPYLDLLETLIDTAITGIELDTDGMAAYDVVLERKIREALNSVRQHPLLMPFIAEREQNKLDAFLAKEPTKYVKAKTKWLEKSETRKKRIAIKCRALSKNWKLWQAKKKALEEYKLSGNVAEGMEKFIKDHTFNVASGKQLGPLLYDNVFEFNQTKQHIDASSKGALKLTGLRIDPAGSDMESWEPSDFELEFTKTGGLPASKGAYKQMGQLGAALLAHSKYLKERTYVTKVVETVRLSEDKLLHPTFKCPGTFTGRLAGTDGFNFQNLPNSEKFMQNFRLKEGSDWVMIGADFAALEPHVLAEISRDKTYLELYGPDAKPNLDVYLHVGAKLPKFAKEIADAGYSILGNTLEALAAAKTACSTLRGKVLKVLQLSSSYGAGVFKIWSAMKGAGVDISQTEVEQIHQDYWSDKVFGGVKKFEAELKEEHRRNKGWVLNPIGRPACCDSVKQKDLVNRCLGKDTLVRTENKGWVKIIELDKTDRVWEGNCWVQHAGVVCNGYANTIVMNDVICTPEHLFQNQEGAWTYAEKCKRSMEEGNSTSKQDEPRTGQLPSYSWSDVRKLVGSIFRSCT